MYKEIIYDLRRRIRFEYSSIYEKVMAYPMVYGLRINDHSGDHADLILNGVRPAWMAMNAALGHHHALALRSHWSNGPHLLLGLARTPSLSESSWDLLAQGLQRWCDFPSAHVALDPVAYRRLSVGLAAAEQLDVTDSSLRPDRSIDRGDQPVADFLDDPGLSEIRDRFKSAIILDIFELTQARAASPMGGVVELVIRLLLLERVAWRGSKAIWPISINAQAHATHTIVPDAARSLQVVAQRIAPRLHARVIQSGALDESIVLSERDRAWVCRLQELHEMVCSYVARLDSQYFIDFEERSRRRYPDMGADLKLTPDQLGILLNSRMHFSYRVLMNMLYDIFPTVGYSPTHRIFACTLVVNSIRHVRPDVMVDAAAAAAGLVTAETG